jgi:hypothetical protein
MLNIIHIYKYIIKSFSLINLFRKLILKHDVMALYLELCYSIMTYTKNIQNSSHYFFYKQSRIIMEPNLIINV